MHSQYWQRNVKNKNKQAIAYASTSQNKKQKPKQEWTTDFVDRSQFKLTQAQMIQKKASLQSKHRQQAKRLLEERRKKLQMGILDDQTRKIYETALTSKNIDINPPIRKNLTEMIRQQRDKRAEYQQAQEQYSDNEDGCSDDQNQQEIEQQNGNTAKDIKDAQNFIRKFQRAKKQQKISRAVQILTNGNDTANANIKKSPKNTAKSQQNSKELKINNFLDYMNQQEDDSKNNLSKNSTSNYRQPQNLSQQQAITSIQDTIKFMEERLFAAKKTVEQTSKSFIEEPKEIQISNNNNMYDGKKQSFKKNDKKCHFQKQSTKIQQPFTKNINNSKPSNNNKSMGNARNNTNFIHEVNDNDYNYNNNNHHDDQYDTDFNERLAEISQLRIKIKQQQGNSSEDDNECMDTIRRMRELMQSRISDAGGHIQEQEEKSYKKLKENVRQDNFIVSPSLNEGLTVSSINKKSDIIIKGNTNTNYNNDDDSGAEVSFSLTNNEDSVYQVDFLGASSKISKRSNNNNQGKAKNNKNQQKQRQIQKINNHQQSQLSYQDQYQKVKQNLFKCIQAPIDKCQKQQQQEDDSLIVSDRINVWKKQLNTEEGRRQYDKNNQDEDEDEEELQRQYVGNGFTKYKSANQPHWMKDQSKSLKNNTYFLKQQDDLDEDQEQQKQQGEQPYKYNCFTDKIHDNFNATSGKESLKQSSGYSYGQMNSNTFTNKSLKKPPPAPTQKSNRNHQMNSMKTLISNMANNVQKIEIMPLKIEPLSTASTEGQMVGFDFRGSINIKKNVLSK